MAGTDHGRRRQTGGPQPAFLLVAPQMGENIGASARAMWNFGLDRMRIVAPRDGWPNPRAEAMASGAGRVLDRAAVTATLAEACADLSFVFATTARDRAMTKRVLSPEEAMAEARALIAAGEQVGFLFGPERAGLENADIARANAIVSVPVNPGYGSLNLAQCVLLLAYEWQRVGGVPPGEYRTGEARLATGIELDRFLAHLVERLDGAGFFFPPEKRPSMTESLGNLFRRAPLTDADIRILHGVVRALAAKPGGR